MGWTLPKSFLKVFVLELRVWCVNIHCIEVQKVIHFSNVLKLCHTIGIPLQGYPWKSNIVVVPKGRSGHGIVWPFNPWAQPAEWAIRPRFCLLLCCGACTRLESHFIAVSCLISFWNNQAQEDAQYRERPCHKAFTIQSRQLLARFASKATARDKKVLTPWHLVSWIPFLRCNRNSGCPFGFEHRVDHPGIQYQRLFSLRDGYYLHQRYNQVVGWNRNHKSVTIFCIVLWCHEEMSNGMIHE